MNKNKIFKIILLIINLFLIIEFAFYLSLSYMDDAGFIDVLSFIFLPVGFFNNTFSNVIASIIKYLLLELPLCLYFIFPYKKLKSLVIDNKSLILSIVILLFNLLLVLFTFLFSDLISINYLGFAKGDIVFMEVAFLKYFYYSLISINLFNIYTYFLVKINSKDVKEKKN